MITHRNLSATLFATAMVLSACGPQPTRQPVVAMSLAADLRDAYQTILQSGAPVLEIDAARSLVALEVRRGGALARLGHDHVVASHDVRGYVAPLQGRADLYVSAAELVVDEPVLRAAAGFGTQPPPSAIEGTRDNMLHRVLRADEYPFVVVSITGARVVAGRQTLRASLSINGATRATDVDASVESAEGELRISGRMTIVQSDYGIVPLAIAGGAIQVEDAVDARFEIFAWPIAH
jgi:hypothetical protein